MRIDTFGEANLTGEFGVSSEGTIQFPLLGAVTARGKTVEDVRLAIQTGLQAGYIKNPSVSVQVLTYRSIYVLGEVQRPGAYPYTGGLTVPAAVALAGGFTYRANKNFAYVRNEAQSIETKVQLRAATSVEPGSTIRIGERYF